MMRVTLLEMEKTSYDDRGQMVRRQRNTTTNPMTSQLAPFLGYSEVSVYFVRPSQPEFARHSYLIREHPFFQVSQVR